MAKGRPRHYVVKRKLAFWQPTPRMKVMGFEAVPLGEDTPEAFALAEQWNRRWDAVRTGQEPAEAMATAANLSPEEVENLTIYPRGSLGAAFKDYRKIEEWKRKAPRTREDWWRGWKRIKPLFGDNDPKTVRLSDISDWRKFIVDTVSLREAHRAVKIWRALWKVSAAQGYCARNSDPSLGVTNTAAKGRSQTWGEGEAVRLFKRAWRSGYHGLACVIAVAWDTQMSPGDVRALRANQLARSGKGTMFFTERGKTGVPVGGALSDRTVAALAAYLAQIDVELHGEAFVFRNRSGAPYSKDTLGDDFRDIRAAEFGPTERRMLGHDFRRSGAVEAIAGGATAPELAHAMGNTLSASNVLFATYVPVNVASIRAVQTARRRSRSLPQ